jgi:hypothetical protein
MAANRVYYACSEVELNSSRVSGAQSVGITTSLDIEQVFQLGQLAIYDNIEGVPTIEITIEKAMNGSTLLSLLGTGADSTEQLNACLGDYNAKFRVYDDSKTSISGTAAIGINLSSMYLTSYSVNLGVDGFGTESITLAGDQAFWGSSGAVTNSLAASQTADVKNRVSVTHCNLGLSQLQSFSMSATVGREQLLQLGDKYPYFQSATFPIETTSELTYLVDYDAMGGLSTKDKNGANKNDDMTSNETCRVTAGATYCTGTKNRQTGSSFSGGGTDGGNMTRTDTYTGYNQFYAGTANDAVE